jgi:SAM-dependent methyltransferase
MAMAKQTATAQIAEREFYDARWKASAISDRDRRRIEFTVGAIPLSCNTILDVGAGDGRLSEAMAAAGKRVTAVDISPVALSKLSVPHVCASADRLLHFCERPTCEPAARSPLYSAPVGHE